MSKKKSNQVRHHVFPIVEDLRGAPGLIHRNHSSALSMSKGELTDCLKNQDERGVLKRGKSADDVWTVQMKSSEHKEPFVPHGYYDFVTMMDGEIRVTQSATKDRPIPHIIQNASTHSCRLCEPERSEWCGNPVTFKDTRLLPAALRSQSQRRHKTRSFIDDGYIHVYLSDYAIQVYFAGRIGFKKGTIESWEACSCDYPASAYLSDAEAVRNSGLSKPLFDDEGIDRVRPFTSSF